MSSKCPRKGEFTKSMSQHIFSNIDTDELLTIVNCECKSNHIRKDVHRPIPNLNNLFLTRSSHILNSLENSFVDIESFFERSCHKYKIIKVIKIVKY